MNPPIPLAEAGAILSPASPLMALPFGLMLLSMAAMPLLLPDLWGRGYRAIVLTLGSICVLLYTFALGQGGRMVGVGLDYLSFIVFIGSLYVVAGGIHIQVTGEAKPWVNCAVPAHRRGGCEPRRHHGRLHAARAPVDSDEQVPLHEFPHGFFYLYCQQRRRLPDAGGRPAFVPGLPQGGALLVDHRAVACRRGASRSPA